MSRTSNGFTLVEVLVAVWLLSMITILLANSIGFNAKAYAHTADTVQAWTVAADKLVEIQVHQEYPDIGTQDSSIERLGRVWAVRTTITAGPYPDTRRVDIEVGSEASLGQQPTMYWQQVSLVGKP